MLWLIPALALATGLPPRPNAVVRNGECAPTDEVSDRLRITYDEVTGSCAPQPGPGGNSCNYWVSEHLQASELVVFLSGCETPLPGRFVRTSARCDSRPVWEWKGSTRPGRRHLISIDGGPSYGWFDRTGVAKNADWCPAPSPEKALTPTPVVVTPHPTPRWVKLPEEGFSVHAETGGARLVWTAGRALQGWVSNQPDAALRSEIMPLAEAQQAILDAERGPGGVAVRFHHTQTSTHFEGVKKRGKVWCTQVMKSAYELMFMPESPVMRGSAEMRSPAPAERCSAE